MSRPLSQIFKINLGIAILICSLVFDCTAVADKFDLTACNKTFELLSLRLFHGEGGLGIFSRVRYLYTKYEQNRNLVQVRDGRFYDRLGEPFSCSNCMYVLSPSGGLYIMPESKGFISYHHSSLLAGKEVAGAGLVTIENGNLTAINNQSGHYLPSARHFSQVVHWMMDRGVEFDGVTVKPKLNTDEDVVFSKALIEASVISHRIYKDDFSSIEPEIRALVEYIASSSKPQFIWVVADIIESKIWAGLHSNNSHISEQAFDLLQRISFNRELSSSVWGDIFRRFSRVDIENYSANLNLVVGLLREMGYPDDAFTGLAKQGKTAKATNDGKLPKQYVKLIKSLKEKGDLHISEKIKDLTLP
jgi:hypothetical protein